MALSIKAEEGKTTRAGHSKTPLTREERAALKNFHVRKVAALVAAVETARGPLTEAQNALTAQVNQAKGELGKGYTREKLLEYAKKTKTSTRDLDAEEAQRFEDHVDLSIPVYGQQPDMFDGKGASMPEEAKDEVYWTTEGFRTGLRADGNTPPTDCSPRFHQAFMKGHESGLIQAAEKFKKGEALSKAIANPPPPPTPEPEKPAVDDPAEIKRQADALKKKGFAEKPAKTPENIH